MIYGVQYSTDSRDVGRETFLRFRREHDAKEWKHEIGFEGRGNAFGGGNNHRYIRALYRMRKGWRAPKTLTLSAIEANADERI